MYHHFGYRRRFWRVIDVKCSLADSKKEKWRQTVVFSSLTLSLSLRRHCVPALHVFFQISVAAIFKISCDLSYWIHTSPPKTKKLLSFGKKANNSWCKELLKGALQSKISMHAKSHLPSYVSKHFLICHVRIS